MSRSEKPTRTTVLGVSLGNKIFDGAFVRALGEWIGSRGVDDLLIFLGDSCEAVNYEVFRGMAPDQALEAASRRAIEIRAMFLRGLQSHRDRIDIVLQTDLENRLKHFSKCLRLLRDAYLEIGEFEADVDKQVAENLGHRAALKGAELIRVNRVQLAAYVLREMAVFYAMAAERPYEIYPGAELFVKRRLLLGSYDISGLPSLPEIPTFTNVADLIGEHAA